MSKEIVYKRWSFRNGCSPLKIIQDKFTFPTDAQGNLIIPKDNILVRVHYASLNPVDGKQYHVTYFPPFTNHGIGKDFSGEVVAVGENITKFQTGDLVQGLHPGMITQDGTFSDYLLINTKSCHYKTEIAKVPKNTNLEQAAAWPLVLGTAMLLIDKLPLKNKKVLVLGGATSVGRYLTQLLSIEGADEIFVSCSPRSEDLVKELGATGIINYRENTLNQILENVKDKPFDYIFDCWGGSELFPHISEVLVKGGTYNTIVGDAAGSSLAPMIFGTAKAIIRSIGSYFSLLGYSYNYVLVFSGHGWIDKAQEYVASGKVKIFVDKVYDFEELPQAIEYIDTGRAQGKLIIEVKEDN
ncbi:hypothetical protein G210_1829 [Candida maltosa Xu316]|uniref:Enoyl reductase (ER) domain-containing protein n=1 Tax=Candida maltosa (strain Xu316) TaxID=1245528 RepID=M3IVM1_CANMX|nr:hypothetical protein G210_1829 [Candida maltosa Xu316]